MHLISVHPKLPMRDNSKTSYFYSHFLSFGIVANYGDYLIVKKDSIEIHFFEFKSLIPTENYGQIYIRVKNISDFYEQLIDAKTVIHPNGNLEKKPWGQIEFSLLDPDNNLLTFGESI